MCYGTFLTSIPVRAVVHNSSEKFRPKALCKRYYITAFQKSQCIFIFTSFYNNEIILTGKSIFVVKVGNKFSQIHLMIKHNAQKLSGKRKGI